MAVQGTGTVTVLVTDLVGSTEVRVAVGEHAADRLQRAHDRLLADVVAHYGGSVVKGTGDGVLATFAGAADAVSAAVEVQQAVHAWDAGPGGRQAVRIGISAGDVTWEGGDCFGTPVIEAARLCAAADGGQVLVADVVRVLARGRHGSPLTALGPLELKGLPEPVATYEVTWEPRAVAGTRVQVPLPSALRPDREFTFAGREAELGRLVEHWSAARSGERQCVLVGGEPGIGKTRLAGEIASVAHSDGATVLYGRCEEDMGFSYQPFVEALQHFAGHTDPGSLANQLGPYGGDLARVCPELTDLAPGLPPALQSEPEAERHRLFEAMAGWLRAAADDQPVVLVIDDLHGAATPALLLLRHVLRATEGARLLVLATYRDTELGRTHPLADTLAELRRARGVERLSLVGLDEPELAMLLGQPADAALTKLVYAETEGNPFFAREVLRHFQESGALVRRAGGWTVEGVVAELGIPEGVREVVGRRLVALSTATNDALAVASVVGMDFALRVLAPVTGFDEDQLVVALDEAVAARLVTELGVGQYRFGHALVRSTLYEELGLTARVRMHRRVGEAIEAATPDDVFALAHHFGLAAAGGQGTVRAARYHVLAAQRALATLAADDARSSALAALDLLDDGEDDLLRCDALTCLGRAERMLGLGDHREHLIEAGRLARAHGDVERLVASTLSNGGGVGDVAGADNERIELIEAALAAVGPDDTSDRARLIALLGLELGAFVGAASERAFAIADEALAVARRVGDDATLSEVIHMHFDATLAPHTRAQRRALSTENLALAERVGDPVALGWALQDHGWVRAEYGEFDAIVDGIERMAAIGDDFGIGGMSRGRTLIRTAKALADGRLAEAEVLADETLRVFTETGHRSAFTFYAAVLIGIRRDQGRLEELVPLVVDAARDNPNLPAIRAALCMIYADLDRLPEAGELLRELAADGFSALPYSWTWLAAMCNCAEASIRLRDEVTASALLDRLLPYRDHFAMTVVPVGAVARFCAALASTLGRFEEADTWFAEAVAMDERAGAVSCLARSRLDWARMLLTRRSPTDADRAAAMLDMVLRAASAVGLPTVERRAQALLAGPDAPAGAR